MHKRKRNPYHTENGKPSIGRKRTNREFRFNAQIGEYNVDNVIMDLGLDVNVLPNQTWETMGEPELIWSPIQLSLPHQHKIVPIG
jgi:hypothetical protein